MTRDQQVEFCKRCTNRQMDMQQGLICSLSGKKADFEEECPDFNLDPKVEEKRARDEEEVPLDADDIRSKLGSDALERFRLEQNYPMALVAGLSAGLLGAILWGVVTVATGYQIGYMAIAIGAGVGFAMRFLGKGIDPIFGITGGAIAILSCFLGNFLSIIGFLASSEGLGYLEALSLFDYNYLIPLMQETFEVIDLLFYGIAAYEGYHFAFRVFTEKDIQAHQEMR